MDCDGGGTYSTVPLKKKEMSAEPGCREYNTYLYFPVSFFLFLIKCTTTFQSQGYNDYPTRRCRIVGLSLPQLALKTPGREWRSSLFFLLFIIIINIILLFFNLDVIF